METAPSLLLLFFVLCQLYGRRWINIDTALYPFQLAGTVTKAMYAGSTLTG